MIEPRKTMHLQTLAGIEELLKSEPKAFHVKEIIARVIGAVKTAKELANYKATATTLLNELHRQGKVRVCTANPAQRQWIHADNYTHPQALDSVLAGRIITRLLHEGPLRQSELNKGILEVYAPENNEEVRRTVVYLQRKKLIAVKRKGSAVILEPTEKTKRVFEQKGLLHADILDAIFEPCQEQGE